MRPQRPPYPSCAPAYPTLDLVVVALLHEAGVADGQRTRGTEILKMIYTRLFPKLLRNKSLAADGPVYRLPVREPMK